MKIKKAVALLCIPAALCMLTACTPYESARPQEITLSFDKTEAYFQSTTPLYPIMGDTPAEGDPVESATVVMNSDIAVRMVLTLKYDEGQAAIPGLVVSVNDGAAIDFTDGAVLYTGAEAQTSCTLSLEIYLEKDSPVENAGKSLGFSLELSALEE